MGATQVLSDTVNSEESEVCVKYLLMPVVIYVSQNRDVLAKS